MSFNLMDSVRGLFGNEFMGKATSLLGENETNIKTAISGIVPSVLTGLLSKAGSGDPHSILNMAKDASRSGILSNFSGLLTNSSLLSKGSDMLKSLFGDKAGNITSMISSFSGIRESSASSLMSMAAPAALGVLGQHATDTNMSTGGMLSFLNSQKDHIMNALPAGLNLAGALGLGSLAGIGSKLSNKVSEFGGAVASGTKDVLHAAEQKAGGNRRWLIYVLGAIAVIIILIFLGKGCNGSDKSQSAVVTTDTTKSPDTTMVQPVTPVHESLKVKLPDGVELDAYKGGIEDQLVIFLNDPSSVAGKNVWFDFDNLNFKTGSAEITDESMKQVQNIVAILKAYPKVKIKIGGYTDKTGDSLNNIKLSKSRADAVVAALIAAGAEKAQVIGGDGYGSQFAKAAADAPDEERQKDRRISVSVRAK
jgi:outer membrane protein OmpA-like peptidoglycan-associated protein